MKNNGKIKSFFLNQFADFAELEFDVITMNYCLRMIPFNIYNLFSSTT
jgi:hypothetical protein